MGRIDAELDDRLEREAAVRGQSKHEQSQLMTCSAACCVREGGEPDDSTNHDEVIYG